MGSAKLFEPAAIGYVFGYNFGYYYISFSCFVAFSSFASFSYCFSSSSAAITGFGF